MAFQIPEGLHPDLNPLAWLIGSWRGKGHGEYPGIENFQFAQEVTFSHDGRPFLTYFSRSWIIDDNNEIVTSMPMTWHITATNCRHISGQRFLESLNKCTPERYLLK